jgi:CheY-like chemotaxis protein
MMPIALAGRRILIVEDEPLIALHDRDLLEEWGAEVLGPATSVATALAMIDSEAPDAVMLDVSLRGQTSEPVAEAMLAAGVPFVVTTAYAASLLADPMKNATVLSKPVNERKLEKALTALFKE